MRYTKYPTILDFLMEWYAKSATCGADRILINKGFIMKKILENEYTPIEHLAMANESISTFVAGAVDVATAMAGRVKGLMPSIITGFKGASELADLEKLADLSKDEQAFLKIIGKVSFAEIRAIRADLPEGFTGDLEAYSKTLQVCANSLARLAPDVLHPYTVFLGQLVSTKNVSVFTDDKAHIYNAMEAQRKAGYANIAKFFPKRKLAENSRIGEVLSRNEDWKHLFISLKSATDTINAVDRQLLKQLMAQSEDYLNILQDMLKKGSLAGITPETSKALANGAFQVASQVEYYTVVYYRVLGLTASVRAMMDRLIRIYG